MIAHLFPYSATRANRFWLFVSCRQPRSIHSRARRSQLTSCHKVWVKPVRCLSSSRILEGLCLSPMSRCFDNRRLLLGEWLDQHVIFSVSWQESSDTTFYCALYFDVQVLQVAFELETSLYCGVVGSLSRQIKAFDLLGCVPRMCCFYALPLLHPTLSCAARDFTASTYCGSIPRFYFEPCQLKLVHRSSRSLRSWFSRVTSKIYSESWSLVPQLFLSPCRLISHLYPLSWQTESLLNCLDSNE